jgi:SAM-dependent MidA family methyltransferase
MLPGHLAHLPTPSQEALAVSAALTERIRNEIGRAGGWISFARYMELALYSPGVGYYSAGSTKLGRAGDFVTAPELSPLFGQTVAKQVAQLIELGLSRVIEIGAGSGALARDLLTALADRGRLPQHYEILEVSGDLRRKQEELIATALPHVIDRIRWIDALPTSAEAVVLGNEVLDAMPVHIVRTGERRGVDELGVAVDDRGFARSYRAATGTVLSVAQSLDLPPGYETEIGLAARAFVRTVASSIARGVLLFIDYGFPAAEYYHPQRSQGTLMCHYRQHAHTDALVLPGLQDITAHVDFTSVADAALEAGHHVLGYTSQAQFLVNCGITDVLRHTPASDVRTYAPLAATAQKLLSPAEMGELFKVIALGRGMEARLIGFARGDRTHTL